MASTISLVESRRPPGVSKRMISARASSSAACAMARFTKRTELPSIAPSRSMSATCGPASWATASPWETTAPPKPNTSTTTARIRLIAMALTVTPDGKYHYIETDWRYT